MSRKEQIQQMLESNPEDVFLNYALALEMDKEGDSGHSLELFAKLMNGDPPYVPAFFMAGQILARMTRNDEAKQILEQGIQQAKLQGEQHAAGEMTEFLQGIDDGWEE